MAEVSVRRYPQATRSSPSADDFNDKMSKLKLYTEQLESFANWRAGLQQKQYDLDKEARDLQKRQTDLQKRQKELDEEIKKLGQECRPVAISVMELEREISLKDALIPFVCTIQDAQLYFQLKHYVIEKYTKFDHRLLPRQIAEILSNDSELRSMFGTILELHFDQVGYAMFFINVPLKKDFVLKNPVYQLVHRSIQTDYVMDEDPMVELRRIMEFNPTTYDFTFRFTGQPRGYLAQQELKTEEDALKKYCELRAPMVKKVEEKRKHAKIVGGMPVLSKGKYADVVRRRAFNNMAIEEKGKYAEAVISMPVTDKAAEKGNMAVQEKGKHAEVVKGTAVTDKAAEKGNMAVQEKGKHAEIVKGTPVSNMAAKEKGKYGDLVINLVEGKAIFAEYYGRRKKGRKVGPR